MFAQDLRLGPDDNALGVYPQACRPVGEGRRQPAVHGRKQLVESGRTFASAPTIQNDRARQGLTTTPPTRADKSNGGEISPGKCKDM